MTQVGSMEYAFKQSGAQAVVDGFKQISAAAKAAEKQQKDLWKDAQQRAKAQEQSYKNAERQYKESLKAQAQAEKQAFQQSFAGRYQNFSKQINDLQRGAVALGAAAYGVARTGKAIYDFGKAGAQIEYTQVKFERLSQAAGTTGTIFMNQLRSATRGTMNDMQLMDQAGQLLQLGLAKNSTEAVTLSRNMTALGQDMGEVTLAIANQSKRRLDQLGLSLVRFNEIEDEISSKNPLLSKEEVFKQAFIQTSNETIAMTGNMADSVLGQYQRLEAGVSNYMNSAKVNMSNLLAPTVSGVADFFYGINDMLAGNRKINWWNAITGAGPAATPTTLMDFAEFNPTQQTFTSGGMGGVTSTPTGQGRSLVNNQLDLMTRYYTQGGLGAGGVAGGQFENQLDTPFAGFESVDFTTLLQGASQLSQIQTQTSEATRDLTSRINNEMIALQGLQEAGFGRTTLAVREHVQSLDMLRTQLREVQGSQSDLADQMMQANIAAASTDEERAQNQLEYARATGQITDEAYKQQSALMGIADAFAAGKITADRAAQAAQAVMMMLGKLDGMEVTAIINLAINGVAPAFTGPGVNTLSTTGVADQVVRNATGNIESMAGGGTLAPVTIVGDSPGGGWTPYTEVIIGNRVYNNREARALRQMGMLNGATSRGGGGDFVTDYGETIAYSTGTGFVPVTPGNVANTYVSPSSTKKTSSSTSATASTLAALVPAMAATVAPVIAQDVASIVAVKFVQMQEKMQAGFVNVVNNKMDEMISVLKNENPRMVGDSVFANMSRRS